MSNLKWFSRNVRKLFLTHNYSVNAELKSCVWKPDNTVISPYKSIQIPNMCITDFIWQNLGKWEDKTAVACAITNNSYTYKQLHKYSQTLAAKLRTKLKIRDGDVVYIMMSNSIEYPVAVLGALQAGAEVTTINPASTIRELSHTLLCSNPKVIITAAESYYVIQETLSATRKDIPVILVKNNENPLPIGTISYHEFAEDSNADLSVLQEVNKSGEDVVLLPFSSGTTGMPKQVELVNRNLVALCLNQDIEEIKVHNDTTSSHQDSILAFLPFFHIYGMSILLLHKLAVGAKLVTLPRFQPETFLSAIKNHKIDVLYAVPPTVLFLGSHPLVTRDHLSSIRNLAWGAAPMQPVDVNKCLERFRSDIKVTQMYGSTEALLVSVSLPGGQNAGCAVRNTEMKIISIDHGRNLGPNEVGELLVRGPQIMKCYKNDPEATKNTFDDKNWYKTGDMAFIDENGALNIVDRLKELIKVKGYQVPPVELENVLKEHPDVLDAAVIGVPDSLVGEVPKAFIVVREPHNVEDIIEFVNNKVADYKRIRNIIILKELPKSLSGKILRKLLKEEYSIVEINKTSI